ncbi:MAG TPA: carboxypeptidase regulatory-like domain-containing protein [Gemmatimonadaceae bacterium]|nr:carboxypeptidase regulatory-like domain-containing protein [Gemmatimonadaceae bacterium]
MRISCSCKRVFACAIAAALSMGAASRARAQVVRGAVVTEDARQTIASALVLLLDARGRQVAATITGEDGRFAFRVPGAGRYVLRTERIGYRSVSSEPFDVGAGQTVERRLSAPSVAVALPAVTVLAAHSSCKVRPEEGEGAALLWSEARKALEATRVAQDQRLFRLTVTRYERTLTPAGDRIVDERSDRVSGVSENPFVSAPADTIAAYGYAHRTADSTFYYAPDAAVLLSEAFADSHCLRVQRPDVNHAGQVGLAFEPRRGHDHTDVKGVLWLDSATAELRTLEFAYTPLPVTVSSGEAGGLVEFERLPTNAWIVERWTIRMPLLGPNRAKEVGEIAGARRDIALVGLREDGGEVEETFTLGGKRLSRAHMATVEGTAFDSVAGVPLTDGTVELAGTRYSVDVDSTGHFSLPGLPEGSYTVMLRAPRITALGIPAPRAAAALRRDSTTTLALAIPSVATIRSAFCADTAGMVGDGLLAGIVRDADSGAPIGGARVLLSWSAWSIGERSVARERQEFDLVADSTGAYRACGVPTRTAVLARAAAPGHRSASLEVSLDSAGVLVRDIAVPPEGAAASASLRVTVRTADGRPAVHAAVRLVNVSEDIFTDDSGTVHLGALPSGTQMLDVRQVGYAPVRRAVDLRSGARAHADIVLGDRVQVLAPVDVVARGLGASGFDRRRRLGVGSYLTADEIERRGGLTLTDVLRGVPGVVVMSVTGPFVDRPGIRMSRAGVSVRPSARPRTGGRRPPPDQGVPSLDRGAVEDSSGVPLRQCTPAYFIDGHRDDPPDGDIDAYVSPKDVAAIEVYTSGAQVPPQFSSPASACGAVVIWTKQGMRARSAMLPEKP